MFVLNLVFFSLDIVFDKAIEKLKEDQAFYD